MFGRNENYPNPQQIPSEFKESLRWSKFPRFRRIRKFTFVFVTTQQRTASCVLGLAPKSALPTYLKSNLRDRNCFGHIRFCCTMLVLIQRVKIYDKEKYRRFISGHYNCLFRRKCWENFVYICGCWHNDCFLENKETRWFGLRQKFKNYEEWTQQIVRYN